VIPEYKFDAKPFAFGGGDDSNNGKSFAFGGDDGSNSSIIDKSFEFGGDGGKSFEFGGVSDKSFEFGGVSDKSFEFGGVSDNPFEFGVFNSNDNTITEKKNTTTIPAETPAPKPKPKRVKKKVVDNSLVDIKPVGVMQSVIDVGTIDIDKNIQKDNDLTNNTSIINQNTNTLQVPQSIPTKLESDKTDKIDDDGGGGGADDIDIDTDIKISKDDDLMDTNTIDPDQIKIQDPSPPPPPPPPQSPTLNQLESDNLLKLEEEGYFEIGKERIKNKIRIKPRKSTNVLTESKYVGLFSDDGAQQQQQQNDSKSFGSVVSDKKPVKVVSTKKDDSGVSEIPNIGNLGVQKIIDVKSNKPPEIQIPEDVSVQSTIDKITTTTTTQNKSNSKIKTPQDILSNSTIDKNTITTQNKSNSKQIQKSFGDIELSEPIKKSRGRFGFDDDDVGDDSDDDEKEKQREKVNRLNIEEGVFINEDTNTLDGVRIDGFGLISSEASKDQNILLLIGEYKEKRKYVNDILSKIRNTLGFSDDGMYDDVTGDPLLPDQDGNPKYNDVINQLNLNLITKIEYLTSTVQGKYDELLLIFNKYIDNREVKKIELDTRGDDKIKIIIENIKLMNSILNGTYSYGDTKQNKYNWIEYTKIEIFKRIHKNHMKSINDYVELLTKCIEVFSTFEKSTEINDGVTNAKSIINGYGLEIEPFTITLKYLKTFQSSIDKATNMDIALKLFNDVVGKIGDYIKHTHSPETFLYAMNDKNKFVDRINAIYKFYSDIKGEYIIKIALYDSKLETYAYYLNVKYVSNRVKQLLEISAKLSEVEITIGTTSRAFAYIGAYTDIISHYNETKNLKDINETVSGSFGGFYDIVLKKTNTAISMIKSAVNSLYTSISVTPDKLFKSSLFEINSYVTYETYIEGLESLIIYIKNDIKKYKVKYNDIIKFVDSDNTLYNVINKINNYRNENSIELKKRIDTYKNIYSSMNAFGFGEYEIKNAIDEAYSMLESYTRNTSDVKYNKNPKSYVDSIQTEYDLFAFKTWKLIHGFSKYSILLKLVNTDEFLKFDNEIISFIGKYGENTIKGADVVYDISGRVYKPIDLVDYIKSIGNITTRINKIIGEKKKSNQNDGIGSGDDGKTKISVTKSVNVRLLFKKLEDYLKQYMFTYIKDKKVEKILGPNLKILYERNDAIAKETDFRNNPNDLEAFIQYTKSLNLYVIELYDYYIEYYTNDKPAGYEESKEFVKRIKVIKENTLKNDVYIFIKFDEIKDTLNEMEKGIELLDVKYNPIYVYYDTGYKKIESGISELKKWMKLINNEINTSYKFDEYEKNLNKMMMKSHNNRVNDTEYKKLMLHENKIFEYIKSSITSILNVIKSNFDELVKWMKKNRGPLNLYSEFIGNYLKLVNSMIGNHDSITSDNIDQFKFSDYKAIFVEQTEFISKSNTYLLNASRNNKKTDIKKVVNDFKNVYSKRRKLFVYIYN
jgi:hypothetical protein